MNEKQNDADETRRSVLRARAVSVAEALGGGALALAIVEAAARYWDYPGADARDFCLQSFGGALDPGTNIVFGGTNRLTWSPWNGFELSDGRYGQRFKNNFIRLGRHPGPHDANRAAGFARALELGRKNVAAVAAAVADVRSILAEFNAYLEGSGVGSTVELVALPGADPAYAAMACIGDARFGTIFSVTFGEAGWPALFDCKAAQQRTAENRASCEELVQKALTHHTAASAIDDASARLSARRGGA